MACKAHTKDVEARAWTGKGNRMESMSGGSYDYLCYTDETEIENRLSDLERMADRLVSLKYVDTAERFYKFIEQIERMKAKKRAFLSEYESIMRAIEWTDSGDWSQDSLKEFMDKTELDT